MFFTYKNISQHRDTYEEHDMWGIPQWNWNYSVTPWLTHVNV